MKKLLTLLLAIMCAFTCVACAPTGEVEPPEDNGTPVATLYKMGKSDYKIVLPEEPTAEEVFAADELNLLFSEATGYQFDIIYDDQVTEDYNYIYIGRTTQIKQKLAGENPEIVIDDDKFNLSGYVMKTIDKDLYISGRMQNVTYGTMYGVYTLLSDTLNFEQYAIDVYDLDKGVSEVTLYEYDLTDIPAIDRRQPGYQVVNRDQRNMHRLRLQPINSTNSVLYLTHSHTFWESVQSLTGKPECQSWFTPDKKSICYSNPELLEYHINYAIDKLRFNTVGDIFTWGAADNYVKCPCPECQRKMVEYGNFTGLNIVYMKQIASAVQEWIDENQPGRKVLHLISAYGVTLVPPTKDDKETGKTVPFCDEVILEGNIGCHWAPIGADFGYAMNDPTCAPNVQENGVIQKWKSLYKGKEATFDIWQYGGNCRLFWVNHGNISVYKSQIQYYDELGVYAYNDQVNGSTPSPAFDELRCYLQAKLLWDPYNNDTMELAYNFMMRFYGEGGPAMYEYLVAHNNWYEYLQKEQGFSSSVYFIADAPQYWPLGALNYLDSFYQKAVDAVMSSKNYDDVQKTLYRDRIEQNRATITYLYFRNHIDTFNKEQAKERFEMLEYVNSKFGMDNLGEFVTSISTYLDEWRTKIYA